MAEITLKEPSLIREVNEVALQEGRDTSDVVAEAVRHHLAIYRQKRIAAETDAWYLLPSQERRRFAGKFVAVYGGQVVDSDTDRLSLFLRLREHYGRQPVLIAEGGDQPIPVYHVRSPRRVRGGDAD